MFHPKPFPCGTQQPAIDHLFHSEWAACLHPLLLQLIYLDQLQIFSQLSPVTLGIPHHAIDLRNLHLPTPTLTPSPNP